MKRSTMYIVAAVLGILLMVPANIGAQQGKDGADTEKMSSENLEAESRALDSQVVEINKKIENVISRYRLMENKNIRILPYQVTYTLGSNYIEIERHNFERDILTNKIIILKKKSIKLFTSGQSLTKIETTITEQNYKAATVMHVTIVDPSPSTVETGDIIFTQIVNNKTVVDGKKLGDIKNSIVYPVRNNIKRDFLIPSLAYFYNVLLNIAETYSKGVKDSDSMMYEFLRKSTEY